MKQVQDYIEIRLSDFDSFKDQESIKKTLFNEILFLSLLKNWAKEQNLFLEKKLLNKQELLLYITDFSKLKALKGYQNFLLIKQAFIKYLQKRIPEPSLKKQKEFYNKNESLFKIPPQCYLKQILLDNENLALSVYQRLKKGDSFSDLENNYSLGKNPGWIQKGQLTLFDQACFERKKALSPPIKSLYGYHIFLRNQIKPPYKKSLPEAQKQIISLLKKKNLSQSFNLWLKEESQKKELWIDKKSLAQIKIQYKTKNK